MHVVHTAGLPPNQGKIALLMIGCTSNNRSALSSVVSPYVTSSNRSAAWLLGPRADAESSGVKSASAASAGIGSASNGIGKTSVFRGPPTALLPPASPRQTTLACRSVGTAGTAAPDGVPN